jgi:hypothetical protein
MASEDPVEKLIAHIKATVGSGPFDPAPGWSHMGAVICDAVLQRRMRYCAVFRRVRQLQEDWPNADTVSRFNAHIARCDLRSVLDIRSRVKPATIRELTALFVGEKVETRDDLRSWLDDPGHIRTLLNIKWVGPKTASYLGILVGRSEIAVDSRLTGFAAQADVHESSTAKLKACFEQAADRLGVDRGGLDHVIWTYMGNGSGPCGPAAVVS